MKRLVMVAMGLCAASAVAMPTQAELKKAQPLVVELMAPAMAEFKEAGAKDKTAAAVKVADASVEFANAAETEAAKFLLLKGAVSFYTRGEAYDKAADAVTALKANVKDVTPAVIAEITGKATGKISETKAPRLFAQYRAAKLQVRAASEAKSLALKLKRVKSDALQRRYAEALAVSGDWTKAYGEFAKLSDAKLKAVVEAEAKGKAKNAEAGEFWWAYEPAMEDADDIFKAHAAVFYRQALAAGEITGLKKNIVEQRIKGYGAAAEVAAGGLGSGASPRTPAATGLYCVIDLSGGPDAKKYPVSYMNDIPKGGWSDEYKTAKLVLRRIEPGKPVLHGEGAQQRRVSIEDAYYIGVFEVTQGQWEKIMGTRPSFLRGKKYVLRPVEQVSYDMIRGRERGSEWPESNQVDADSFIGCMRARTGLDFDLPTNGQWEYACCAGVGTDYNNGGKCTDYEKNPAMNEVGRYFYNGGWSEEKWGKFEFNKIFKTLDRECGPENGTAIVGSYAPNKWGLYDMHGNVFEWCLDRKGGNDGNQIHHVVRSGWWIDKAGECHTFVCHKHDRSNHAALWYGLRLCLPLAGGAAAQAPAATSTTGSIELKTGGDSPFTVKGNEATLELKNGAKLEFVKCPSGWVKVVDDYENKTVRKVKITRPFWIMKQGLRNDDVIGRTLEKWGTHHGFIEPNQEERDKFCLDLTDELKGVLPKGYVVRPPSLVEWEYAYHAGDEDPGSEPFGSLLKFHDWSTFDTHKGTSPVNKWGLHDFHVAEQVFDRIDLSRASVKVTKKDKKNISKLPDAQSDKDVFFWSDDRDSASYFVRWPTGCVLELKPKNSRVGFVRLVIGPDLVSEWKAKNGKK